MASAPSKRANDGVNGLMFPAIAGFGSGLLFEFEFEFKFEFKFEFESEELDEVVFPVVSTAPEWEIMLWRR